MRRASFWFALLSGAFLTSACGARTSGDELIGYEHGTGGSTQGACCSVSAAPGCGDSVVEQCVCANDSQCCQVAWDSVCVSDIETFGCGTCSSQGTGGSGIGGLPETGGAPAGGGGSGGSVGNCCSVHGGRSCDTPVIADCTCAVDSFCCATAWDATCIQVATSLCGAGCFGGTGGVGTGGGFTGGTGGVSTGGGFTGGTGGVSTGGVSTGGVSTGGVSTGGVIGGSGGLPTGGTSGSCCSVHGGVGCSVPSVEGCVCGFDPYCCNVKWDEICVNEATDSCSADCNGGGGTGGTSQCEAAFPGACGSCLCNDCYGALTGCLGDFGCIAIYNCISSTGCSGLGCYTDATCKPTIDSFGGLGSDSFATAVSLGVCSASNGCPCN